MLNRLTVSALLKTVILATAFCVVIGFSLNAWDSWGRLQVTNRIAVIADASADLFKAMHNLRTDRSTTDRLLNSDAPIDSDIDKYLRGLRDAEMPAMANALQLLPGIEFASSRRWCRSSIACSSADRRADRNSGTRSPSRRPRAAPALPQGISWKPRRACSTTLDKLSGALAAAVNHQDADDRPVAGDQADRLAAAQHRRRGLADRFEGTCRRPDHAGNPHEPTSNSSAAPISPGKRWN